MFKIKSVETKQDWDVFVDLPWSLYKDDRYWVPQLRIATRDMLDVRKNPFFRHSSMHPLIAMDDGRCVGRAVGIIDENHNRFHKEETASFGFFECIDNQSVANLMLETIAAWARERGMKTLRGPMNPSTNHECGLLVDGFNDSPLVMMTYNPPYYANLLESYGFKKTKDLYAYSMVTQETKFSDRLVAHAERMRAKGNITFRTVNMRKFDQEVEMILDIYNDAWEKNWGFVPMDEDEFRHMAKDMKMVLDPELLLIAEVRGQPAGFALTLPDVNQVFKKVPDGKLLPLGIFKLLWNLKGPGRKKTIDRLRVLTLGIKRAYREAGIGPLLYTEYYKRGLALGYRMGEASWILEDNKAMNRSLELMGAKQYKTYRLYDRPLF